MGILDQSPAPRAFAEEPPAKPNFRSCGRGASAPARQREDRRLRERTSASIPSRVETTLLAGARERLGFGAHALRFGPQGAEGEAPGPGAHDAAKVFHEELGERYGWGARGTGGFASRSRRFGIRSMPQLPPAGLGCPGPGAYDDASALKRARSKKEFNRASSSAVFAHPLVVPTADLPAPGPGAYDGGRSLASEAASAQSAFRSLTRRSHGCEDCDPTLPGPGAYAPAGTRVAPRDSTFDGAHVSGRETSVFKELTKRRWVPVHADLPVASERARSALGSFAREVARECEGTTFETTVPRRPGPGTYDQDREGMWEAGTTGQAGSSCFLPGSKRVEWAPEEVRSKPGPGRYEPRKAAYCKASGEAVFNSATSQQTDWPAPLAPGPAFYNPGLTLQSGKSFHLNSVKQWLA